MTCYLDPLQFTYWPGLGVMPQSTCSAEHTLTWTGLAALWDTSTTSWIIKCITDRPQVVQLKGCVSGQMVSGVGTLQGSMLSFLLHITPQPSSINLSHVTCRLFSSCGVYQWWWGGRVKATVGPLCDMVEEQPPCLVCGYALTILIPPLPSCLLVLELTDSVVQYSYPLHKYHPTNTWV